MRILKWVFLVLYVIIVGGLVIIGITENKNDPSGMRLDLIVITASILAQVIFIFGSGTKDICKPIHRRRLLIPVIISALMMTILFGAIILSLSELFRVQGADCNYIFWIIVGINWIIWSGIFYLYTRERERYKVLKRLILALLAGSLLELMAAIPFHIIVSRRPGCFVAIFTMFGIIGGIGVMLWSFGPGIILLFLREKYKNDQQTKPNK